MKNGWKRQPFEDCIERATYTQKIQRKDFLADGPYPVISQEEDFINGYWDNEADLFKVTTPIVVFGDHTKVLKYVDFDFVLGADGVKILQPREFLLPKFFFYQLQAANLDSLGYARHYRLLKELEIAYPGRPEQQRIVGILDEAFEGIAIAKANAEKNLQNARALFESHLQSVFTQRGKGWVDAKLGSVCHKITDGTHITPTYTKEGVPFLSVKNLTQGFIDFSDTRFISVAEHEFLTRRCKPIRGDILYTKVGTTGIAQVVDVDNEFSIFVSVALLKPKHDIIFNLYLEHFLNAPYAREQAQKRTRGMANRNLVITDIKEIDVHFPKSLDEQRTIVAKLESLAAETQRLESLYERKLDTLEALKKSLLHQAFTGQLTMTKG